MARSKSKALAHPVTSDEAADWTVGRIGELERYILSIDAELQRATAAVKAKAEAEARPLIEELRARLEGLQAYCESHRARLTREGRQKSYAFGSGVIGWRTAPPAVAIRNVKAVLAAIQDTGGKLKRFLRTKVEVDKEAMLKEPALASTIPGVSIGQKEEFFVEPARLELAAGGKR